ncbi:DUF192 domain-containing protein [Lacinutrix sp. C3R15]|uniref:DUF192 domain-containing protein n=1 Tax=Flavobacteriaceae TaxID=49546 RepID=UPI001C0A0F50|nr:MULTISPECIES: DUF192 domain-containing protein [Flavobacteriaceae]MBU2940990.1 DUF192 domain-containing protein [Lacinutrix sp. C3R15]MDO6624309.1 DUF192 domain-containing protein [Oceanihabitans sp. 1_MG-2023]
MRLRILFYTILCSFLFLSACKDKKKDIKPIEISFKKEGDLTIYKAATDSIVTTLNIEIADTDYDIQTGLMYRNTMQEKQGMLFVFPTMRERFFYMKNTRIPLDLIYLDNNKHIVSFQENAKPFDETSLPSRVPAQYVLEINAGLAQKWLLEVGDRIEYTEINKE